MHTSRRAWLTHVGIIVAYAFLALVLTWPLVAHLSTHVPGNGVDDPPLTWNLWWVSHALLDTGTNPFHTDYLFYPLGINLAYYTLTLLNGLLSIPLQASMGLVAASNLLLLSSFVLSGYGAFLVASFCLRSSQPPQAEDLGLDPRSRLFAAAGAGLLYAFASSKLAYAALGQWNIASSQWIPFYVLYLLKMGEHPWRWRYPLMATLFLLLQAYAELTFASFLILFTLLWAAWLILTQGRGLQAPGLRRTALNLVVVGLLFSVGLLPILTMMIPDMLAEGDILVEGGGFADVFSADLLGFLVPTMYHPVFGTLVDRFNFDHSVGQHIYLGYLVLLLAIVVVVRQWARPRNMPEPAVESAIRQPVKQETSAESGVARWIKFWSLSALVFGLLVLGPALRINGQNTGIPMPFALVAQLPFFEGNRYPSRYSVMLMFSLAMLVAFSLATLLQGRRKRTPLGVLAIFGLLASFLLFEHLSIPLSLSDMRVPLVYQTIADAIPGDATLLDLPVAWRNGFRVTGTQHPIIMFQQYYQSIHGLPILGGNTSRNPPLKFQYFTQAPVINTLIALETGHEVDSAVIEQDQALAADVLRFFDIQAIVVHPEQTGPHIVPYVEVTMPVERFYQDEQMIAYWTHLPPWPKSWIIEPGDPMGGLSFAEGWGIPENGIVWAQRPVARLLVPMNGNEQRMTFRAYAPENSQRLQVEVDGHRADWIDMAGGWGDYEVTLPAEAVRAGLNEVRLHFDSLFPANQVRLSPRTIGQTAVESPVNLAIESAGQEVGDLSHIYVNGQDFSPNERGYNLVVLDPESGEVWQQAAFDTHLDEEASQSMAAFLAGVPSGYIVAVAAADEASRLLDEDAVQALRGIGASGDLRGKWRWSHAIAGVQGAPPGSAREALDWMRPVTLVIGEGATEPHLVAAFAAITSATTKP